MSAQADDEVQMAIEITNLCQRLHVLPRAGGLFDQDSYHVHMMNCVLIAQDEQAERKSKQAAATKPGKH